MVGNRKWKAGKLYDLALHCISMPLKRASVHPVCQSRPPLRTQCTKYQTFQERRYIDYLNEHPISRLSEPGLRLSQIGSVSAIHWPYAQHTSAKSIPLFPNLPITNQAAGLPSPGGHRLGRPLSALFDLPTHPLGGEEGLRRACGQATPKKPITACHHPPSRCQGLQGKTDRAPRQHGMMPASVLPVLASFLLGFVTMAPCFLPRLPTLSHQIRRYGPRRSLVIWSPEPQNWIAPWIQGWGMDLSWEKMEKYCNVTEASNAWKPKWVLCNAERYRYLYLGG